MRFTIIKAALIVAAIGVLAGGSYAGADALVTGAKVKNNSLTGLDIQRIKCGDLDLPLRKSITACNGGKTVTGSNGSITVNAPQGDQGPAGSSGSNGKDGAKGDAGATGTPGATGGQGVTGPTGSTGPQGLPGAPGADGANGSNGANGHDGGLPNGFFVTNKSVGLTKSGVDFGPYANGGAAGGSLYFNGLNGKKLSDITQLSYTERHSSSDGSPIAAPYLRIFLNGDADDVVFDATKCASTVPAEGTANTYEVTTGEVRYDDDSCDGVAPDQQAWAAVLAAHGDDIISGIYVTTGFAGGTDLAAKVSDLKVNDTNYHLGS